MISGMGIGISIAQIKKIGKMVYGRVHVKEVKNQRLDIQFFTLFTNMK